MCIKRRKNPFFQILFLSFPSSYSSHYFQSCCFYFEILNFYAQSITLAFLCFGFSFLIFLILNKSFSTQWEFYQKLHQLYILFLITGKTFALNFRLLLLMGIECLNCNTGKFFLLLWSTYLSISQLYPHYINFLIIKLHKLSKKLCL